MSAEQLEKRVRDFGNLQARLEKCHDFIGKMCKDGRPPKMTIPVQWHDEDFFIATTIQDAIAELSALQARITELEEKVERAFYDGIQQGAFGVNVNGTTGALVKAEEYAKKVLSK